MLKRPALCSISLFFLALCKSKSFQWSVNFLKMHNWLFLSKIPCISIGTTWALILIEGMKQKERTNECFWSRKRCGTIRMHSKCLYGAVEFSELFRAGRHRRAAGFGHTRLTGKWEWQRLWQTKQQTSRSLLETIFISPELETSTIAGSRWKLFNFSLHLCSEVPAYFFH